MRVIQNVGFYYPDSLGGTEVYVESLTSGLREQGIESIIAAPSNSSEFSEYVHNGTNVFRYPTPKDWLRSETQYRTRPRFFEVFENWLSCQSADVYHQHSWTTGCGLWHLEAAKRLGLKTVLTVHVPGNICMRGTMLLNGADVCDGEIMPGRCASCWLQSKGIPATSARCLAALPVSLGPLARLPRIGPALAARALAASRSQHVHEMAAAADRLVAVCDWLHAALRANGVPSRKLLLSRQGVRPLPILATREAPKQVDFVRVGFLGRWDPLKGIHILVDAFKRLPAHLPVTLDIRAADSEENAEYKTEVQEAASCDGRIRFSAADGAVAEFLQSIDVLAVPSQSMETGPLVVLEAFAVATPVMGSNLGGIRELVSHERDGLLIAHNDVAAWSAALQRFASDLTLRARLRAGIGPVRTASDVTRDMAAIYRNLIVENADAA